MNEARLSEIENLAMQVREYLNVTGPIENFHEHVRRLGGTIEFKNELENGMEGKIFKEDGTFTISIKDNVYEKRKRFTIAHELGHLFIHMGYMTDNELWDSFNEYNDSVYYRYGHSIEEREANAFAAAFLMPKEEFIIECYKHYNGENFDIAQISNVFNVSEEAAFIRGQRLGIFM
jgi:Zn-dependent peptidase ImmA (M78 family)